MTQRKEWAKIPINSVIGHHSSCELGPIEGDFTKNYKMGGLFNMK
jgi:hypothetical protein